MRLEPRIWDRALVGAPVVVGPTFSPGRIGSGGSPGSAGNGTSASASTTAVALCQPLPRTGHNIASDEVGVPCGIDKLGAGDRPGDVHVPPSLRVEGGDVVLALPREQDFSGSVEDDHELGRRNRVGEDPPPYSRPGAVLSPCDACIQRVAVVD